MACGCRARRSMRHWCGQVGLKLSEKALAPATREERGCYVDGTYSTNTTSVGNALPVGAERDVFDLLGLVYEEPSRREGKPKHQPMLEWSSEFVCRWVEFAVCLPEYGGHFRRVSVDGKLLQTADEESLAGIGIAAEHVGRFIEVRDLVLNQLKAHRETGDQLHIFYRRNKR